MLNSAMSQEATYQNLLESCPFVSDRPVIEAIKNIGATQLKRVLLKAGTQLDCHQASEHVIALWLRGKARFQANGTEFTMHPGSLLEMPSGTPHSVQAETDCVFTVFKFKTA